METVEIVFKDGHEDDHVRGKIEENWFQLITGINIIDLYVPDNGIIFAGRYFDISDNADRYESSSEGKQTKSK